jgi:hypothetical protein
VVIFQNFDLGIENAKSSKRKILLIFDLLGSSNSSVQNNLLNCDFHEYVNEYTIIVLNVDDPKYGSTNKNLQINVFGSINQPMYYILDGKGQLVKDSIGYCKSSEFGRFIKGGVKLE